jgi:ribonuclease HI
MGFKFRARGPVPATWHDAPTLRLYTDGSAYPATNSVRGGGWGFVLCEPDGEASPIEGQSGRCPGPHTTSQRSELQAAVHGLTHVLRLAEDGAWSGSRLELCADSQYVLLMLRVPKLAKARANQDLVAQLRAARSLLEAAGIRLDLRWVKGHGESLGNQHADQLSTLWRG